MEQSRFHNNKQNGQQEKYFHTVFVISKLEWSYCGIYTICGVPLPLNFVRLD